MKILVILVAIFFSANAFAQAAPKAASKPAHQVKPKEPMGCKLVGTVRGTKLWAGDCLASELRGAAPAGEAPAAPEPNQAIPPGQKQ
jgi:hypothetical protein